MPNNWLDDLAAKLAAMPDVFVDTGRPGDFAAAAAYTALRNHADRLIAIARAAEAANTAYFGAGNELEAMQNLRAALEAPDGM